MKKTVLIGLLGVRKDDTQKRKRWDSWRPSIGVCQQDDLVIDRFELLRDDRYAVLANTISRDLHSVSPETELVEHTLAFEDPWDFEEVFAGLHSFARSYPFDPENEDYLVHITTGTHVAQICLYLLTESRHIPGRLIQSAPPRANEGGIAGSAVIIDLDLSRYDQLAARFADESREAQEILNSGIATKNAAFNRQLQEIEKVAVSSRAPILILGPTGAGKSRLARRIHALKSSRHLLDGNLVELNCATLRGDAANSTLFGHVEGSFTGAVRDREGVLKTANGGLLFLDEIGELGLDEQAMLLRALEEKRFMPLGSDVEVESDFQLIAGTNRDLGQRVREGLFRDDLLARIDHWTFALPPLAARREDIEPNVDYELDRFGEDEGRRVSFRQAARTHYLQFASSDAATWLGNFRDLSASIGRMATLAPGGRIDRETVDREIERLRYSWGALEPSTKDELLKSILGKEKAEDLDRFDRVQLTDVVKACRESKSLSEAGRRLFASSRLKKRSANDADRLRKYLARFDLDWDRVQ